MSPAAPATPILDRIQPPPEAKAPQERNRDWAYIAVHVAFFIVILPLLPVFFFIALFTLVVVVPLHEVGHVVAGLLTGFSFRGITVGCFRLVRTLLGWRLTVRLKYLSRGHAHMVAARPALSDWRYGLMIAGGPLATFLLPVVAFLVPLPEHGEWVRWFVVICAAASVAQCLLPYSRVGDDGYCLLLLLRGGEEWERWKVSLMAETAPAGELDKDARARAAALSSGRAVDRLDANLLAHRAAIARGDLSEAATFLETALSLSGQVDGPLRSAVFLKAAYFKARLRRDAATARAWMTDAVPAKGVEQWQIDSTQATVLLAEGHPSEAAAKASAALESYRRETLFSPAAERSLAFFHGILDETRQVR